MENGPSNSSSNDNYEKTTPDYEPLLAGLNIELEPGLKRTIAVLKGALLDANTDQDTLRHMWIEYSQQFEALVERADSPEAYTRAQIAAIIHKALIFRDTNNELRYLEELDKADMYSANSGLATLSTFISTEVDSRVSRLDQSPERLILQLRNKVSDANRAYLWDLWADEQDYEDLVNHAFEMLLEEGEDPLEVLTELGVLEA